MEELLYTDSQYERLRENLQRLYETHKINSSLLIRAVFEVKGRAAAVPKRTDLDKIRRGEIKRPKGAKVQNLWETVHKKYGGVLGIKPGGASPDEANHPFFEALSRFYDVDKHRNSRLVRFLTGRFVFYHFSEMLWDHASPSKKAIVVGQFDISASGHSPVVEVVERQDYDGRLGRLAMKETYKGYCLPKGSNLCFLMRCDAEEKTPKFYTFDSRFEDHAAKQTTWMSGYMLKPQDGGRCFHSPVYAERASDDGKVGCNVLARSEIDPRILRELERAQPVRDW